MLKKLIYLLIGKDRLLHYIGDYVDRKTLYVQQVGYLAKTGWINSIKHNTAIDCDNTPIPWLTFPFIKFIEKRLKEQLSVLEFGSGNSTIYFASFVSSILSFEDNEEWYKSISTKVPAHAKVLIYPTEHTIINTLNNENRKFDVVLIDNSGDRCKFAKLCLNYIHDNGIIILDDSELESNIDAVQFLLSMQYKRLDFYGLAPMITYQKCTSIFYKSNNCLNI